MWSMPCAGWAERASIVIPLAYNTRSLLVRKTTTTATALGIALVVFVLACSLMLASGVRKTLGSSGDGQKALVLRKGSEVELSSMVEQALVGLVLSAPGVARDSAGPLGAGEVLVVIALDRVGSPGQISNVQLRGISERSQALRPQVRIVAGRAARPGTDEVIIGQSIAGRFDGVSLGSTFELRKNRPVTVVGVFAAQGSAFESEVWADIDTVRGSFGREGLVSSITVQLTSAGKFDRFESAIETDKQLGLDAINEREYYENQSEGTSLFISITGTLIASFFAIGAMLGAMITMYAAVAQREREIGTLRALGFSRAAILSSFLLESLLLALLGGVVGALASLAMSLVSFSMVNFATWSEVVFTFDPTVTTLLISLLAGGGMGLVGGLFPAIRAARTSPIKAMRA
jgi:putative ABC transport system permease protein